MGFITGMIVGAAILIITEILGLGVVAGIVKWF
jgi:hypothetical protein